MKEKEVEGGGDGASEVLHEPCPGMKEKEVEEGGGGGGGGDPKWGAHARGHRAEGAPGLQWSTGQWGCCQTHGQLPGPTAPGTTSTY